MNEELCSRIEAILDQQVRPALAQDGGGIDIYDFQDGVLQVRLLGQCSSCPSAATTMDEIVKTALLGKVEGIKDVELVQGVVSDELLDFARKMLRHEI